MTTSYFSKLAEQRRIKRSREEALKKIKHLNPRDYQAVKKAHERLLKEAREARRRRVKEGGPVAGKGRSGGLHLVMSDLGPAAHASDEAAKVTAATAETDGGEVREKAASAKILAAAGRRSKFTKKYANSMPDMDRQAIRAGLKEDREEKEKAKTKAKSDKKRNGEEEEKAENEEDEEEAVGEEEDEDADEPHEGKAARLVPHLRAPSSRTGWFLTTRHATTAQFVQVGAQGTAESQVQEEHPGQRWCRAHRPRGVLRRTLSPSRFHLCTTETDGHDTRHAVIE
jgi:hypothetical protein